MKIPLSSSGKVRNCPLRLPRQQEVRPHEGGRIWVTVSTGQGPAMQRPAKAILPPQTKASVVQRRSAIKRCLFERPPTQPGGRKVARGGPPRPAPRWGFVAVMFHQVATNSDFAGPGPSLPEEVQGGVSVSLCSRRFRPEVHAYRVGCVSPFNDTTSNTRYASSVVKSLPAVPGEVRLCAGVSPWAHARGRFQHQPKG